MLQKLIQIRIYTDFIYIVPADLHVDSQKKCTIYGKYDFRISYKLEVTVKYKYNDLNGNLTSIIAWPSKYYPISSRYTGEYDYTRDTFAV